MPIQLSPLSVQNPGIRANRQGAGYEPQRLVVRDKPGIGLRPRNDERISNFASIIFPPTHRLRSLVLQPRSSLCRSQLYQITHSQSHIYQMQAPPLCAGKLSVEIISSRIGRVRVCRSLQIVDAVVVCDALSTDKIRH